MNNVEDALQAFKGCLFQDNCLEFNTKLHTRYKRSCRTLFLVSVRGTRFIIKTGRSLQNYHEFYLYQNVIKPIDKLFFPIIYAYKSDGEYSYLLTEYLHSIRPVQRKHYPIINELINKYSLYDIKGEFTDHNPYWNCGSVGGQLKIYDFGFSDLNVGQEVQGLQLTPQALEAITCS